MAMMGRGDDGWGPVNSGSSMDWIRPVTQWATAPVAAMLSSLNALAAPGRRALPNGMAASALPDMLGMGAPPVAQPSSDDDLSGDDLKAVDYLILFNKPDLEATLQPTKQVIINYPTDAGSLAGLLLQDFLL